ncbi:MAG: hypothetical protein DI603_00805 [Roseateles depolymerans]|uniref:Uncharacterized protein n=1 Tax=Roseateles depolymerans TaxID=76731 RepID=A0A2W5E4Z1_9BURK|nr:MAG: hypothetical protein DI603_00805 [Roseateles depolymerans]
MRRRQHLQHLTLSLAALLAPALASLPARADRDDDGEFLILQARYGTEHRHVDVTERLREVARRDRRVRVTNDLFGIDPDPGRDKLLRIYARDRQGRELRFDIREDDWLDGAQFVGWAGGRWGEPGWQGDWQAGRPGDARDDGRDDGAFVILYATWGLPSREVDVTPQLRELARRDQRFKVEVERFDADPAPGRTKRLHIVARDRHGAERSFDYPEYSWVDGAQFIGWSRGDWGRGGDGPPRGRGLLIESARYGADGRWMDVTGRLRALARDGRVELEVSNELLGGDPAPGRRKMLSVSYRWGGEPSRTVQVSERDWLRLP